MLRRLVIVAALTVASLAFAEEPVRKPRVAVLYFDVDDRLGDLVVFRKGLAEMLITDLVATEKLTVVERAKLEEVTKELDLKDSKYFKNGKAIELGDLLQVDWKVTGTILPVKTGLIIEARLISTRTAQIMKSARVMFAKDDVLDGEQKLAEKVAAALADAEKLPLTLPKKDKAAKLKYETAVKYGEALSAKDAKDPEKAKVLLNQVVTEQPDFILARIDLGALAK